MNFTPTNKILLWNKKTGLTSFQSLGKVKKLCGTRKVGHTGTLDKFAQGLMILLTGKLTRLNPLFSGMDKSYQAEISFGKETATLDPEGEVIAEAPLPDLHTIEEKLQEFLGPQEQIPPLYSAIHVNGKRAWKRARDGEEVEMKSRPIQLYQLEIIKWESPRLWVNVRCSKGTYIRSLARDLGLACGSRAYLTALTRTEVGPFRLEQAWESDRGEKGFYRAWDLADLLPRFYRHSLSEEETFLVHRGRELSVLFPDNPFREQEYTGLFDENKELAAVVKTENGKSSYLFVVPVE